MTLSLTELIKHYTKRLAEETRPEGKAFLRQTLHGLKTIPTNQ